MAVDFDWRTSSAPKYLDAYRRAIDLRSGASASSRSKPLEAAP
jgi:hypothetical protein